MANGLRKTTPRTPEKPVKNWTVMVYMAAGQSHELDMVAVRDLKEMERGTRGNENVNVVALINRHWPPSAQMYEIREPDTGSRLVKQLERPTNMGAPQTLEDFLRKTPKLFPARNFCLVLWGHAYGLGFGRDHQDPLHLTELQGALQAFREARKESGLGDTKLEILGANACAMSYIEAVYQLRDVAQYMVTSQITVPFAGWPYDTILGRINSGTPPAELASQIVDAYVSQFDDLPGGNRLEMSAINLAHAGDLHMGVEGLAKAIDSDIRAERFNGAKMAFYRDVFTSATAGDVRPLIDAKRLCDGLADADTELTSSRVRDAAGVLGRILKPGSRDNRSTALIEYHYRHATLDDLNGLGIFAPFVTDDEVAARIELNDLDADRSVIIGRRNKGRELYKSLDLFKAPGGTWPTLVFDTLRRTIPADLMAAIDGVTEMRRGDRADVAQIVMAIESSLNQLDRATARARRDIVKMVEKPGEFKEEVARAINKEIPGGNDDPSRSPKRPRLKLIPPRVEPKSEEPKIEEIVPQASSRQLGVSVEPGVMTVAVETLERVERALSEVERTAKRGFTHTRFGLGLMSPGKPGLGAEPPKGGAGAEPPKGGAGGEPPKGGSGGEPPKGGSGGEPPKGGSGATGDRVVSGDLRSDLALARVAGLFGDVGACLGYLEAALKNVEVMTRAMLETSPGEMAVPDTSEGKAEEIEYAFDLLQEASAYARRTVRYVLSHPVYGLGPAEGELTFDVRQELARAGGLSKRQLRLL